MWSWPCEFFEIKTDEFELIEKAVKASTAPAKIRVITIDEDEPLLNYVK